jgi:hypothetical protein
MYAEESLAYCSGQCQASRYPPATCRCPCQGRNHGILRFRGINITPTKMHDQRFAEWMGPVEQPRQIAPLPLLPHIQPKPTVRSRSETDVYPVGRAFKKFVKKITGYKTQDDLNSAIVKGLRNQFNTERVEAIIDQAFTIRQSQRPQENRPELYELYETGEIDKATELFGSRWVIGRPKIRH